MWNCTEEDIQISDKQLKTTGKIVVSHISFKELEREEDFTSTLKKVEKRYNTFLKNSHKKLYATDSSFIIRTDFIYKTVKDSITNYTFRIDRIGLSDNKTENFIVSKNTNTNQTTFYIFEIVIKEGVLQSHVFRIDKNRIKIKSDILAKTAYIYGEAIEVEDCVRVIYEPCNGIGNADGHAATSKCDGSATIFDFSFCSSPWSYGGGSNSGESNSNPENGGSSGVFNQGEGSNYNSGGSYNSDLSGATAIIPPCEDPIHGCSKMPGVQLAQKLNITDQNTIDWLNSRLDIVSDINTYLQQNNYSEEAKTFAQLGIQTWINNSNFDLNTYDSFQNYIPPYKERMSSEELSIFYSMSNINQKRYLYNAYVASNKAIELFPDSENSWHNDKADAFRHAYFHSLNTYYIGIEKSKLLGDAHEIDTPESLILEKTMDLFNNEVGRNLAQNPPILMNGYGVLAVRIQNAILNGDLVYISPLLPPYGELLSNSILIPTNQ